ncbi:Ribosome assembly protein 4 [Venturia nashicola]|uniref:Phosphatidylinositol transfer protein SFH5 n=1 Tax=Venturia nashicola TaxID=86259 RepID=A0A4Z1PHX3_9PEZI|nr:Ribosome assembly protein 4 [Venturia nashicola]TLD39237.1 Ribosome assembly protein 4 [Venturia nashicola]
MAENPVPQWPELTPEHPLSKFLTLLPAILETTGHAEIYGIKLDPAGSFHTKLILQKLLRANANDVTKAKEQLTKALTWRKEFQPEKCLEDKFPQEKFAGLGYVTVLENVPGSVNKKDICTWNIYGAVKDNKKTFGDLDAFMRWRIALMELGISKLDLASATKPIPDFGKGPDPYQGIQVHEYMNVSFIRQDPLVKAASSKAIEVFSAYYPETMSRKFFVSVPLVMQWMFTAMKLVLAKETVKKFTVMSYPNQLATELGQSVPKVYGGTGEPLETMGETLKMEKA